MGNIGSNRYDVYPSSAYTIGDEWHVVDSQIDEGGSVTDCGICGGNQSCFTTGDSFFCPGCPPGYTQTDNHHFCWTGGTTFAPCCSSTCCTEICNSCHVPDYFTRYKVYVYRFFSWVQINEYTVHGQFWS
ncbi:hypothetical protein BES34_014420 [Leptospira inadai serovar Lyme]|uniref:TNFR-Cys domain-containing protein n=1 Tax=Leptospira inadai serovar Lyme TaxID=293084 RepID=A0ABX4YGJ8_9LEPT|nr:hypothetical protein BES34_014420 [Leptospira inadai serovar Lyme]